jgi:hypothetical protein
MIMKRSTIAKTFVAAAVTALAMGIAPAAKAQNRGCSNLTLRGAYADKDTGFITGAGQFAGVNIETFDGRGGLTGNGFSSVDGAISSGTFSGTYTVNPDCTGTYTVQFSGIPPIHAFFVIDEAANELQVVITDPGNTITCVAKKLFPGLGV